MTSDSAPRGRYTNEHDRGPCGRSRRILHGCKHYLRLAKMAPTVTKVAAARNTADFDLKVHTILWTSPYERSNYPRNRGGGGSLEEGLRLGSFRLGQPLIHPPRPWDFTLCIQYGSVSELRLIFPAYRFVFSVTNDPRVPRFRPD